MFSAEDVKMSKKVYLGHPIPEATFSNGKNMDSMVEWVFNPSSAIHLHYKLDQITKFL